MDELSPGMPGFRDIAGTTGSVLWHAFPLCPGRSTSCQWLGCGSVRTVVPIAGPLCQSIQGLCIQWEAICVGCLGQVPGMTLGIPILFLFLFGPPEGFLYGFIHFSRHKVWWEGVPPFFSPRGSRDGCSPGHYVLGVRQVPQSMRAGLGSWLYASGGTRPDVTFIVGVSGKILW